MIRDSSSIYGEMFKALSDVARRHGLNLILYDTNNDPGIEKRCIRNLIDTMAMGIIVVPVSENINGIRKIHKKTITLLLALMLCMTILLPAFASAETNVQSVIAEAASISWDELLAKAKAEIGDNELHVYGTTSRVNEETFTEKTGIKIVATNPNDSQIFLFIVILGMTGDATVTPTSEIVSRRFGCLTSHCAPSLLWRAMASIEMLREF